MAVSTLSVGCAGAPGTGASADPGIEGAKSELQRQLAGCQLDTPIELGTHNPTQKAVSLVNARLDQSIQTAEMRLQGNLQVDLFEIKFGSFDSPIGTGFLGVSVKNVDAQGEESGGSVGFANLYSGDVHLQGNQNDSNGSIVFETTDQDSPNTSETHAIVRIDGTRLVALQLVIPIENYSQDGFYTYSGKNQTLCLKSARLK